MHREGTTSWNTIRESAAGDAAARERFATRYERLVRDYLAHRWRNGPLLPELEDGVQEVFVECFRDDGLLARVRPGSSGGFRGYLYGAVRNIARRIEERTLVRDRHRGDSALADREDGTMGPPQQVDRLWARAVLREAIRQMIGDPDVAAEESERRRELLVLRFDEGLPIRTIAERWQVDADALHLEYAKARRTFKRALKRVLYPDADATDDDLRADLAELASALSKV